MTCDERRGRGLGLARGLRLQASLQAWTGGVVWEGSQAVAGFSIQFPLENACRGEVLALVEGKIEGVPVMIDRKGEGVMGDIQKGHEVIE